MIILDPGHIYQIPATTDCPEITFKFIKRGGGAVTYPEEWPGIQTQAVMRAVIDYLSLFQYAKDVEPCTYELWQLGTDESFILIISDMNQIHDIIDILEDRSKYLNNILFCTETGDAIWWLGAASAHLMCDDDTFAEQCRDAAFSVRMALLAYEVRAYRRKQEEVNRKQPEHDDTASPKAWRLNPYPDVPFNEDEIELRPIGPDGHIVLDKESIDA